jgi:hypothetical protein
LRSKFEQAGLQTLRSKEMLLAEERAYVVLLFGGALYAFENEVKHAVDSRHVIDEIVLIRNGLTAPCYETESVS